MNRRTIVMRTMVMMTRAPKLLNRRKKIPQQRALAPVLRPRRVGILTKKKRMKRMKSRKKRRLHEGLKRILLQ